jgi:hypothetical protein
VITPFTFTPIAVQLKYARPFVPVFGNPTINADIGFEAFSEVRYGVVRTLVTDNALTTKVSLYEFLFDNSDGSKTLMPTKWGYGLGLPKRQYLDPVWYYDLGSNIGFSLPVFGYGRIY